MQGIFIFMLRGKYKCLFHIAHLIGKLETISCKFQGVKVPFMRFHNVDIW